MRSVETRKSRLLLRACLSALLHLLRPFVRTIRFDAREIPGAPRVYAIWHEELVPAVEYLTGTGTLIMVSGNHVGASTARILRKKGYHVIFGSTRHGGDRALRKLIASVRDTPRSVLVAVDGSRGPRRVMKPGACLLARRTGLPLQLMRFRCRGVRLPTWDRLVFPLPFTRVRIACATIPAPDDTAGKEGLGAFVARCQERMESL
jgi:lysophospholipid acyltransferase (LPLAT)-like uncharacterized protein